MTDYPQFMGLDSEFTDKDSSRIVVLPVPFDGTCSWGKGASRGPDALIAASAQVELYNIETGLEPYRLGMYTDRPVPVSDDPEEVVLNVYQRALLYLDSGRYLVTLGGEHSVTTGAFRAAVKKFPGLSVLQLDAHADMRDEYEGSPWNHACVMARLSEEAPVTHVGIRSMDRAEAERIDPSRLFLARDIHDNDEWMDTALATLNDDVYLTIDLDVFDIALLPATGTPEPGGLSWYRTLRFLERCVMEKNVVAFDVVELSPHEHSQPSDFLAAKLVYTLLAYLQKKGTFNNEKN